ncbi:MAG: hypothetical protein ACI4W2_07455 [Eubacterium sp.]
MKKKLAVVLLAAVVAVTMMVPLQVFAENTTGVPGQNVQQENVSGGVQDSPLPGRVINQEAEI